MIYQYRYDKKGRLVEKKIPGAAAQIMLYDPLDRVILTQDGNLRSNNEWQFTKYDILGRPIQTGITTWQSSAMAAPTPMFGGTGTLGNTDMEAPNNLFAGKDLYESPDNSTDHYTKNAYPDQSLTIHSVTWYDDYDFDEDSTPDPAYTFQPDGTLHPLTATASTRIKGKIAGTKVLVLDGETTPTWLHTVTYYDSRNRVIQIQGEHHLGGKDITTTTYDFTGKALQTKRQHTATGQTPLIITNAFHYDHSGRLTRTDQTVNHNGTEKTVILSANEYDDLGQVIKKKLHSANGGCSYLQETDYTYNIRGWMTAINDPDQMQGSTVNGLCEVEGGWQYYPTGGINQYTDVHLQPSEDGAVEATYEGTTQFACGFRTQNPDGSYSQYMMLGRNGSNNKWYIWGQGWTVHMDKPPTFIQSGDSVRFERQGDDFKLYVNDNLEHTVQGAANSYSLDEIAGYCKTTGSNPNMKFYKSVPTEPADLFAMKFDYTSNNTNLNADAQYNGNISSIEWKVKGREKAAYGFQYDDLNRLTNATFSNINSSGGYFLHNNNDFSVSNVSYDKQGNILTLNRKGMNSVINAIPMFGDIDQLTYTYQGNQLHTVSDAASINHGFKTTMSAYTNYVYDANGNMTTNPYKNMTVQYNHQNMPTYMDLPSGEIEMTYDAAGVKLKKEVTQSGNTTTKDYVGGIEYADNVLEAIYHEEGRISVDNGLLRYEYTLKDHLGNSRVMFADINEDGVIDENTEILQENHYYPFGMRMEGLQTPQVGVENKYGYNSKEMNDDFGLDWIDYGARWYDPSIARWSAVDPLSEKYVGMSPYNYVANNPIILIDPDGREIDLSEMIRRDKNLKRDIAKLQGQLIKEEKTKAQKRFNKKLNKTIKKLEGLLTVDKLVGDLREITGLDLTLNEETGILDYTKDEDQKPIINNTSSSSLARESLIDAIENPTKLQIIPGQKSSYRGKKEGTSIEQIALSSIQINKFIDGASGTLNNKTMGYGMTFLHELFHSPLGGSLSDNHDGFGILGDVVKKMNIIRDQLGEDYGQRLSYSAEGRTEGNIVPFNQELLNAMQKNSSVKPYGKYIAY